VTHGAAEPLAAALGVTHDEIGKLFAQPVAVQRVARVVVDEPACDLTFEVIARGGDRRNDAVVAAVGDDYERDHGRRSSSS
jgi:hypothetical protein